MLVMAGFKLWGLFCMVYVIRYKLLGRISEVTRSF